MSGIRVQLKLRGLNELMRSKPVQDEVDRRGRRMAASAGDGFEYISNPHRFTARGYVQVNSAAGARRQAREDVLERSIDAGR